MNIPIPRNQVALSSKLYRKSPNENVVVMEHTVRVTDGTILQDFVLVKPMLDTSGTVNGSLYPVREEYDDKLGIYRSEFEIVETVNTDLTRVYSFTGAYRSLEVDEDVEFKETITLTMPEPAPKIIDINSKIEDNQYIITFAIRRQFGKIPKKAYLPVQASKHVGLLTGELISSEYNPSTGDLTGVYLVESGQKNVEIDFETEISTGQDIPTTPAAYKGSKEVIRLFDIKTLARTVKKGVMSVVLGIRWKDTGLPPNDFKMVFPFLIGTNVPSGTVDIKSISYSPVNGVYAFDVKVSRIPEGPLEYSFATKAQAEGYPLAPVHLHIKYEHQSTYSANLVNVVLSEGHLSAEWSVTSKLNPNYKLENLSVPMLELGLGLKGKSLPDITWLPGNTGFITTWVVDTDNSQEQNYDFRGHFLIDNKRVPWGFQVKALPIGMTKGKIERQDSGRMMFVFTLVSDGKLKNVDATGLVAWVDGIPIKSRVYQGSTKDPSIVTGSFLLPEQTNNKAEVVLLGHVVVKDTVTRFIPVKVVGEDYIPFPVPSAGVHAELISHTLDAGIEKVSFNIRFDNKINYPLNAELVDGIVISNGEESKPERVLYKDGTLTIWNKVKVTGLRQEISIKGAVSFAGYSHEVICKFSDTLVTGSDTLPAIFGNVYSTSHKDRLSFSFNTSLRNGSLPKSVKLVSISETNNIVENRLGQASFIYNPESGDASISVTRKTSVNKVMNYAMTLKLLVDDGVTEETQSLKMLYTQDFDLIVSTQFIGHTYKDSTLTLKHKVTTNKGIPEKVSLSGIPELMGCSSFNGFKYNNLNGELTYTVWMPYLGGVQPLSIDFGLDVPGLGNTLWVTTGTINYSPSATATHAGHKFNEDGTITCTWMFKDAVGEIPKLIRIEDFWKYNINIEARTVDLVYDPVTGLGSVTVKRKDDVSEGERFYAETTFKFPSPDVNSYPLRIDLNGQK